MSTRAKDVALVLTALLTTMLLGLAYIVGNRHTCRLVQEPFGIERCPVLLRFLWEWLF